MQRVMALADITKNASKEQISNANGLLIVSAQSFANFMADSNHTTYLDIAMSTGMQAAKNGSQIFALSHQIPLQSIDIEILPTDSIYTNVAEYHANFLPSFTPKKFSFTYSKPQKEMQKKEEGATRQSSMRKILEQARAHFQKMQEIQHVYITQNVQSTDREQEHCGFIAKVSIRTNAHTAPNIECMYALHTTLLTLFGIFAEDSTAVITQMRLTQGF